MQISIIEKVDFDNLSICLRSDGIAYVKVKANDEINVKHVVQVVDTLEKFGKGKKFQYKP